MKLFLLPQTISLLLPVLATASIFTPTHLDYVPESFVETADWKFKAETTLDISVDDCFNILMDDDSWQIWFPEVQNIRNLDPKDSVDGYRRIVDFNVLATPNYLLFVLLFGVVEINETIDIVESQGDTQRIGFYFSAVNRPMALAFSGLREEYRCQALSNTTSQFTYRVGANPGVLTRLLQFFVFPSFVQIFEQRVPERLVDGIQAGLLPRGS